MRGEGQDSLVQLLGHGDMKIGLLAQMSQNICTNKMVVGLDSRLRGLRCMSGPVFQVPSRVAATSRWMALSLMTGCAVLHSVQLGEIDSSVVLEGRRFEIKVNELGFDVEGVLAAAEAIAIKSDGSDSVLADIYALSNMGPRTGLPVYNDEYSDGIIDRLRKECPSGQISGLMSIRESAEYAVISGEIVKIVGYCAKE